VSNICGLQHQFPAADLTAAAASTTPAEQPGQLADGIRAVLIRAALTCAGVSLGLTDNINAATPEICGAAIEVPAMEPYVVSSVETVVPLGKVDVIQSLSFNCPPPGAAIVVVGP